MKDYALELLHDMLSIYSPSGSEHALGSFLEAKMRQLGYDVARDEAGNVVGRTGRGQPNILLCGHMDTVPGEIPVRNNGERLFGRGAVDAKSTLASMIIAASRLGGSRISCSVTVAGLVDEEGKGAGVQQLLKDGVSADYVVVGEPSGSNGIVIGYKGSLHLTLRIQTPTGHSASPWLSRNSVEVAFALWEMLRNSILVAGESRFSAITGCLTKIQGGSDFNLVPSECVLGLDIRVPPKLSTQQVLDSIRQIMHNLTSDHNETTIHLQVEDSLEPYEGRTNSILVSAFRRAIRQVTDKPTVFVRKTGSSDMNVLGNALRVPTIAYGPGDSSLDHTPRESISIEEYLNSIRVYQTAISLLAGLHSKRT